LTAVLKILPLAHSLGNLQWSDRFCRHGTTMAYRHASLLPHACTWARACGIEDQLQVYRLWH